MTGTIFGCLTTLKAAKDAMWNEDTYECPVILNYVQSDGDLGYHVIWHGDDDWENNENIIGMCGVYPQSSYNSSKIPQNRGECFNGEAYKPSIGNKGQFCVCVKPNESNDAETTYSISPSDFESAQQQYEGTLFR